MEQWVNLEAVERDPDKLGGPGFFAVRASRSLHCLKICGMAQLLTNFWTGFLA